MTGCEALESWGRKGSDYRIERGGGVGVDVYSCTTTGMMGCEGCPGSPSGVLHSHAYTSGDCSADAERPRDLRRLGALIFSTLMIMC